MSMAAKPDKKVVGEDDAVVVKRDRTDIRSEEDARHVLVGIVLDDA